MAMETLTRPRHVKVGVRIYAAQFFDYVTGEVLPGLSLALFGPAVRPATARALMTRAIGGPLTPGS